MKKLIWLLCLCATSVYATDFGDIPANTDISTLWVPPTRTLTIGGSAQSLSTNRTWTATTILDSLSSTQGTVLYRGASNWVGLGPGTDGNVLTTHGASSNPTWTTPVDLSAMRFVTTHTESLLSNEFSLGSIGSGILKQTVTSSTSTPAIADSTDVIALFSGCSGSQYLGADGACHTATVTIPHSVSFIVDGAGQVLSTGTKNPIKIPFGGTLTGWLLIAKPSGSVTVDILRAADGAGLPASSIIGGGGTKPALSSAVENSSTSFTSWTSTTLTAKDNMAISLSGIATSTYCALTLYYQ